MTIILFAPPGMGKSTIINKLSAKGYRAIDLEHLYPAKVRFQLPNDLAPLNETTFLGAADLDPKRKYPNSLKVLLTAEQEAYDARRAQRDKGQPGKAVQRYHDVEEWAKAPYDFSVDTTNKSPDTVITEILQFLKTKKGVVK